LISHGQQGAINYYSHQIIAGRKTVIKRIITFAVSFCLIFEQSSFAQVAGQIQIPGYLANLLPADNFSPAQLRSVIYNPAQEDFRLMLDAGDENMRSTQMDSTVSALWNYFQIGLRLPNSMFWVNLRPDSPRDVIDPNLEKTDVGKILLAADLQLKKDMARFTSPDTADGRLYWNKLYAKAEQIYGQADIEIPTITRPWIVPGEVIIKETAAGAYIYKAGLNVMLEQDYLKDSPFYSFSDPNQKEMNAYSSELIRNTILPRLIREVNSSKRYAGLRQVYYSVVLAQWFKSRLRGQAGAAAAKIDSKDLAGLTSSAAWSKDSYYNEYKRSFSQGEYKKEESVNTASGLSIRTYFSGGAMIDVEKAAMPVATIRSTGLGEDIDPGALIYAVTKDEKISRAPTDGRSPDQTQQTESANLKEAQNFMGALLWNYGPMISDALMPRYVDPVERSAKTYYMGIDLYLELKGKPDGYRPKGAQYTKEQLVGKNESEFTGYLVKRDANNDPYDSESEKRALNFATVLGMRANKKSAILARLTFFFSLVAEYAKSLVFDTGYTRRGQSTYTATTRKGSGKTTMLDRLRGLLIRPAVQNQNSIEALAKDVYNKIGNQEFGVVESQRKFREALDTANKERNISLNDSQRVDQYEQVLALFKGDVGSDNLKRIWRLKTQTEGSAAARAKDGGSAQEIEKRGIRNFLSGVDDPNILAILTFQMRTPAGKQEQFRYILIQKGDDDLAMANSSKSFIKKFNQRFAHTRYQRGVMDGVSIDRPESLRNAIRSLISAPPSTEAAGALMHAWGLLSAKERLDSSMVPEPLVLVDSIEALAGNPENETMVAKAIREIIFPWEQLRNKSGLDPAFFLKPSKPVLSAKPQPSQPKDGGNLMRFVEKYLRSRNLLNTETGKAVLALFRRLDQSGVADEKMSDMVMSFAGRYRRDSNDLHGITFGLLRSGLKGEDKDKYVLYSKFFEVLPRLLSNKDKKRINDILQNFEDAAIAYDNDQKKAKITFEKFLREYKTEWGNFVENMIEKGIVEQSGIEALLNGMRLMQTRDEIKAYLQERQEIIEKDSITISHVYADVMNEYRADADTADRIPTDEESGQIARESYLHSSEKLWRQSRALGNRRNDLIRESDMLEKLLSIDELDPGFLEQVRGIQKPSGLRSRLAQIYHGKQSEIEKVAASEQDSWNRAEDDRRIARGITVLSREDGDRVNAYHSSSDYYERQARALREQGRSINKELALIEDVWNNELFGNGRFDGGTQNEVQAIGNPVQQERGGIDFRAVPMVTQPGMGLNAPAIDMRQVQLLAEKSTITDLDKEWDAIQQQMKSKQMPYARMKGYVAVCCQRKADAKHMKTVTACVSDILKLEEKCAVVTCPEMKELLVIIEAVRVG
jgi:hypothetical protein